MGKNYEEVAKVLVVDVELLKSTTAGLPAEEIATRISYSVWWSRLWTLQEAVFATEFQFQFQNTGLDGKDLVGRSDAARDVPDWMVGVTPPAPWDPRANTDDYLGEDAHDKNDIKKDDGLKPIVGASQIQQGIRQSQGEEDGLQGQYLGRAKHLLHGRHKPALRS
ncbi:uncharacterized protein PV07_05852 [Cladophialophora immunda]|uniref:Heterokaryon incompatibility domain-containing protein n=1 Tax=Cladophialophora immunda TaxID=569365 RepID=A0A0D1ZQ07_9EURO|nr:uncharacterized protein PV07_05852 [Cladophialophora immunda]KIW30076.1 hypothetical protein PV07_05852 [Cladophialophora immunda]